jgi:hypothetical protein
MKKSPLILFLFLILLIPGTFSQNFYRISGEFSIKGKAENSAQLIMGRFFYDKNERKIIHENIFPEKALWVTSDTNLYKVVNHKIVSRQTIPDLTIFSMYHLILSSQLNNFGLEGSAFLLENVEENDDQVITTWMPPNSMKKAFGKIMISSKEDNLYGIIFFNSEDIIIKKQFFEDYSLNSGLPFPGKITEITYKNGKEIYQVTTYKNIKVNDKREENLYHFNSTDYQ